MDNIDISILEILQENCRTPLAKIGRKVGLSAPSVIERIRKLEDEGIIKNYVAMLDSKRVGKDITAFIGVSVSHPEYIDSFVAQVQNHHDILECHHVTGEHTLMLKIKTDNTTTLEKLIRAIRSIQGVTQTMTLVVLSTTKESAQFSISHKDSEGVHHHAPAIEESR